MNTENTNTIELKDSDLEQVNGAFLIGGLRRREGYGYGYGGLGLGLGLGLYGWDEGCGYSGFYGGGYPGFYGGGYPGFYGGGCGGC